MTCRRAYTETSAAARLVETGGPRRQQTITEEEIRRLLT